MKARFGSRKPKARSTRLSSRGRRARRNTLLRPSYENLESRRLLVAATDLATVTGTLFDDTNFNGVVDVGEPRLQSAQVQLIDQSGVAPSRGAITDANGVYTFGQVTAGTYVVRQPAQTLSGGRQLLEKLSPQIVITAQDASGTLSTPIDSFDSTSQTVTDLVADGIPVTLQMNAPEAIWGQRDLIVNDISASDDSGVQLSVASSLGVISFDTLTGGDGERRVVWDGIDNDPINVDDTGLSVDLTAGNDALGFNLVGRSDSDEAIAILTVYSDDGVANTAGRYSFFRVQIPETDDFDIREIEYVPFNSFTSVGGGADFTNITAIELDIEGGRDTNGVAELIGAFAPTQFTSNFNNFDEAELALAKSVNVTSPNVGDTVTYTVSLTNNGPATATGVQVTDQLPAGVRFISSSAGTNYDPSTGIWSVGSLSDNGSAILTLTGQVETVGTKNNIATITASDQTDANTSNNQASAALTPQQIDLELTKTVSNPLPNIGEAITFTVVLSNTETQTATGVQVRDLIPSGLRIASPSDISTTTGVYNTSNGVWDVGTVNGLTTETLSIRAIVEVAGARTNVAEVISANEADIDSIPGDGMGDDYASVDYATASADLELTKVVDNPAPDLRSSVNFTITVTNQGPNPATGVTVLDRLPAGMTFLSSSDPSGYNPNNGIWNIGSLTNGGSTSLTILASVDQTGTKTNTARIETANENDPDSTPGNDNLGEDDQAQVSITPVAADLSLTKSVNNLSPDAGDTVRFQITVANSGPSTATNVQVRDDLPDGVQFVAASYAPGSGLTDPPNFNPTTGVWQIPQIVVGTPVTLNLDVLVVGNGLQSNVAQVIASDQIDPDSTPGNGDPSEDDQDDAGFRPRLIDLMLTKTVDNFSPSVGDEVEFVVTVNNTGDDVATGVTAADQVPPGVSLISVSPSRGSFNSATGIWTIGTVGINDPVTLTLRTRVDAITTGTNIAEVVTADQNDIDSIPGNGVPTEDDYATVTFTTESADLSLQKTVLGDDRPNAGDEITFELTVTNDGPDNATGIQVTDLLPAGLRYQSNSVSDGIYNPTSGVWTIGEISAPAERQTLIIGPELYLASSGTMVFTQQTSPIRFESPVLQFQTNPLGETANALQSLGFVPSQYQLRQVSLDSNPTGLNIEIRFTGESLAGLNVPRIDVVGNLNTAVNTETIEDDVIGVNNFATLRINALVDTTDEVINVAEVTASDQTDPDSTPGNGSEDEDDRATATIRPQSIDLSLTKAADVDVPNPGDEVVFTVTVTNSGQDAATGVEVTDKLPEALTFLRSDPSGTYDAASGVWTVGQVEVGQSRTLSIVARADSMMTETNDAEVTAADQRDVDSTPGNGDPSEDDQASASVTPATADLAVTKTVNDEAPNLGSEVTFTIVIDNEGPDTATGVQLRDELPPGMTLQSFDSTRGVYDAITGVWSVDTIAVEGEETLTLVASVDSIEDKTNVAQIIASDQLDPDSTPANDDPNEDDQDSAFLSPELIDLALTKMSSETEPNIGDIVTFDLDLTNDGPSDATGVSVLDKLPEGLIFLTSRPTLGVYDPNTGVWTVGTVAVGSEAKLQIEAVVRAVDSVENTAEVIAADQPDSDSEPGNGDPEEDDQASVTLTTQVADLSLVKVVDNDTPGRSDEIEFTVRVSNTGPNTATDVIVSDPLPAGLRFVDVDPTSGEYDPEKGLWHIPTIQAGEFAQMRLIAAVTSAEPSTNVAEIVLSRQIDPDSTPGNGDPTEDDIDSAVVTPRVIDLSVSGSIDNDEPLEGETFQVAFTATNDGASDATGIEFEVPIPEGFALISSQPQTGSFDSLTGRWTVGDVAAGEATRLILNLRVDQRGIKYVPIELTAANEFDVDSTPANGVEAEDDQTSVLVRAPRLLQLRLFLSR